MSATATATLTGAELDSLLLFSTVTDFTPGPNTTLAAALAANHSLHHAMCFFAGVPIGWGPLLVATASSMARL